MKAKPQERARARELRAEGWSLRAIAMELDVALSSVSNWVRDVQQPAPRVEVAESVPASTIGPEPTQVCSKCRQQLPTSAFNRHPTGLQWYCRECFKRYYRNDRANQRARNNALKTRRVSEARALVDAYLATRHCVDCGEHDPVLLEFDHIDGSKRAELSTLVCRGVNREAIIAELAQCEVVCVNCHRIRTALRGNWRKLDPHPDRPWRSKSFKRNFLFVCEVLRESGCVDCCEDDILLLDFDHVGEKTETIGRLLQLDVGLERLQREIARCEVRCGNCHRRRTALAAGYYRARVA